MKHYDTYSNYTHNHLMWMKSKQILTTNKSQSSMNSFNFNPPKPFQQPLGGFIWPPRSYTCSFCKRKFRSAQALGGHMNVHRRDRAKLKQSPSPKKQTTSDFHHSSYYQETHDAFGDHKYALPRENMSNGRNFQNHPLVFPSMNEEIREKNSNISCDADFEETKLSVGRYLVDSSVSTVKDGKRCKKSDRYSGCSSMGDIDLELRLGHTPAAWVNLN